MNYRRALIRFFTFLGGLYFFLEFVLPGEIGGVRIDAYHEQISNGFIAIGAMALGLGLINLLMVHGSRIVFRRRGWTNSIALLGGLVIMILVTWGDWGATREISGAADRFFMLRDFATRIGSDVESPPAAAVKPVPERVASLLGAARAALAEAAADDQGFLPANENSASRHESYAVAWRERAGRLEGALSSLEARPEDLMLLRQAGTALGEAGAARRELLTLRYEESGVRFSYTVLYDGLFVALGSAMFSLLGFYIAAAAYRAFRVRSAESALMMVAALCVMLGQIPFGIWLWDGFPELRLWLLSTPSTAAFRAIKIGAAVAGLILAFRMWFSIESESFSGKRS